MYRFLDYSSILIPSITLHLYYGLKIIINRIDVFHADNYKHYRKDKQMLAGFWDESVYLRKILKKNTSAFTVFEIM